MGTIDKGILPYILINVVSLFTTNTFSCLFFPSFIVYSPALFIQYLRLVLLSLLQKILIQQLTNILLIL